MSTEEFNEKWKDYLEEGHYGLDINNEEVVGFLDRIFVDLTKIKGFQYAQIKQKFYFYCFYCNGISAEMKELILDRIENIMEETNG
jgi:hypothetical protein